MQETPSFNEEIGMTIAPRIEALKAKHALLEDAIDKEALRPCPDTIVLRSLKWRKLVIKDEIARLTIN